MALPLFSRLVRLVEEAPDQLISIVEFFDHLKDWFPNENLQELAKTIIGWTRFAGLLVYSSVSLGLPERQDSGRRGRSILSDNGSTRHVVASFGITVSVLLQRSRSRSGLKLLLP